VAGLSQVLIWYLYHDLVPTERTNRHSYLDLPRDQITGWIRFGYELGCETSKHNIRQLPSRLQETIDELGIDGWEVCRRLIRLSNADEMKRHEMANVRVTGTSRYLAIGEKLEADKAMIAALRPLPRTLWADWQHQTLEYIEAYMDIVIRPAIDPTEQHLHSSKMPERDTERKEIRRLFNRVCDYHTDTPLGSIYDQALAQVRWARANEVLMSREHIMARQESRFFPDAYGQPQGWDHMPYGPSRDLEQRRRSAPVLDEDKRILLSIQENMDSLREDVDIIRVACFMDKADIRSRATQRLMRQEKGLVSRAQKHMEGIQQKMREVKDPARDTGTPEGDADTEMDDARRSRRSSHAARLPRALQSIMLNMKASKSTPDLTTYGLQNGQGPDHDLSSGDEYEQGAEQTAVQQHIFNLSPRANGRQSPASGSLSGPKEPLSYSNSVRSSDPENAHYHPARPLDTQWKRNGRILDEEFNSLRMHPVGLASLHHSLAAQVRNDSILPNGQQRQANGNNRRLSSSEEGVNDPFNDFTSAHFGPGPSGPSKNVTFAPSHGRVFTLSTSGHANLGHGTSDPPEKSKYRLSETRYPDLDDLARSHPLTLASPLARRNAGDFGSPGPTVRNIDEPRNTTPTTEPSSVIVERRKRVLSPTSSERQSSDGIE
jgi:hypothetical protein